MSVLRALLLGASSMLACSCLVTSDFDGLTGGTYEGPRSCGPTVTTTPRFCRDVIAQNVEPVIDGRADEFCGRIEPVRFVMSEGALDKPRPPPPSPVAWIRFAAHPRGLHFHVAVDQPTVTVASLANSNDLWEADSVEIFAATGDPARLTGLYGLVGDKGVIHPIFAPPDKDIPARMTLASSSPNNITFAARRVVGGYEVEGLLPWNLLTEDGSSAPGERVQINVALNYWAGERFQNAVHHDTSRPAVAGCEDKRLTCDDRTWCNVGLVMR